MAEAEGRWHGKKIPSGWGLEAGSGTDLCWQEKGSSHVL